MYAVYRICIYHRLDTASAPDARHCFKASKASLFLLGGHLSLGG